jgi:hypothetical protein
MTMTTNQVLAHPYRLKTEGWKAELDQFLVSTSDNVKATYAKVLDIFWEAYDLWPYKDSAIPIPTLEKFKQQALLPRDAASIICRLQGIALKIDNPDFGESLEDFFEADNPPLDQIQRYVFGEPKTNFTIYSEQFNYLQKKLRKSSSIPSSSVAYHKTLELGQLKLDLTKTKVEYKKKSAGISPDNQEIKLLALLLENPEELVEYVTIGQSLNLQCYHQGVDNKSEQLKTTVQAIKRDLRKSLLKDVGMKSAEFEKLIEAKKNQGLIIHNISLQKVSKKSSKSPSKNRG